MPFLRKCDLGPFVDLLLDCCEEIECEEGTELTTQGTISEFLFIIIRGISSMILFLLLLLFIITFTVLRYYYYYYYYYCYVHIKGK
jgi:hypothetical protein